MTHLLDNPIWNALTGPHAGVAIGTGLARRYPREIAPFCAFAEPTAAAYADIARDLPAGVDAWLLRPRHEELPPGWEEALARPVVQMVRMNDVDDPVIEIERCFRVLDRDDAAAMVTLAEANRPGPFALRTHEFGHYIGVFANGRLTAMAGERMRVPGHVEISAVAVDPAFRGRGLAAAMIRHLCRRARERGETPFLHAWPDNPAIALYERLGFRLRRELWLLWRRPRP